MVFLIKIKIKIFIFIFLLFQGNGGMPLSSRSTPLPQLELLHPSTWRSCSDSK
jgi:hypothetical protein